MDNEYAITFEYPSKAVEYCSKSNANSAKRPYITPFSSLLWVIFTFQMKKEESGFNNSNDISANVKWHFDKIDLEG